MSNRKKVFIGHHENDNQQKELVYSHLAPLEKNGLLKFWCISEILPGQNIAEEIDKALRDVKIAIPLISIDFVNKELDSEEIKKVINNHQNDGLKLYPILLKPCIWEEIEWLSQKGIQILPKNNKPLSKFDESEVDEILSNFARKIRGTI